MLTLTFLVKTLLELYVMVLLIRIWMQWSRCDFYTYWTLYHGPVATHMDAVVAHRFL